MLSKVEISRFLETEFPQTKCKVESVAKGSAIVRHPVGVDELRPGGTVSGPVMMSVADVAMYVAILASLGLVKETVTTSLTINFLRKPKGNKDILADCKILKLGKTLAVAEVSLFSEGEEDPVAHVVGTYAIPKI
jgi:uncharacterized protein (TIGR00369 family)